MGVRLVARILRAHARKLERECAERNARQIWFELVDTRKQYGTDAADREHVNKSQQQSDVPSRRFAQRAIYIERYTPGMKIFAFGLSSLRLPGPLVGNQGFC
jgi:hypothetical protein